MATIKQITNKDSSVAYKVTVSIGRDENNKQIRKYSTFTPDPSKSERQNQKDLRQFAADFESRVKNGTVRGEDLTLSQFTREWFEAYAKDNLEKRTYRDYQYRFEKWINPLFGYMKLSQIRPLTIQRNLKGLQEKGYVRNNIHRPFSDETIGGIRRTLSSILSAAVLDGIISDNPCTAGRQRARKQKVKNNTVKTFTPEEAGRFLDALDNPIPVLVPETTQIRNGKAVKIAAHKQGQLKISLKYKAIFTLIIFSGLRREEAISLQWKDVDFKTGSVTVRQAASYTPQDGQFIKPPKSENGFRTINLPPVCMDLLKELKRDVQKNIMQLGTAWVGPRDIKENFCFTQETGKMMYLDTPGQKFKQILDIYNRQAAPADRLPEIRFYDLRHTHASLLISQGLDVQSIASRLGHANASTTLKFYSHSFQERDRAASDAVERLIQSKRNMATGTIDL